MVEVSGDERLRRGPCSPGANGPTGVPPVRVHPRGELLGHPRGAARHRSGPYRGAGATHLTASRPGGREAHPRCSLARAALLIYPNTARPWRAAFSRVRVLAWCEHLLSDDDGRPRGECLPAC